MHRQELPPEEHPQGCGGTYEGVGFVPGPLPQAWRARCLNHGRRLVESTNGSHGPFRYVEETVGEDGPTPGKTPGKRWELVAFCRSDDIELCGMVSADGKYACIKLWPHYEQAHGDERFAPPTVGEEG